MGIVVTDAMLHAFLEEQLPPQELSAIEQLLRDDLALQKRLLSILERENHGVHTIGAIWRRNRISCPSRERLGSFLLGALDESERNYIQFHVEELGCQYCKSSLIDLQSEQAPEQEQHATKRRQRYFESSVGRQKKDD